MSRSELEEALYGQMLMLSMAEGSTFPLPVREHHFDWCCEHADTDHREVYKDFEPDPYIRCCLACPPHDREHQYRHGRMWRFDFAWPTLMLAAEAEGGIYTGGRHVRGAGYEKDLEKYNYAAECGWTVLRFSRRQINSGEALRLIERALKEAVSE